MAVQLEVKATDTSGQAVNPLTGRELRVSGPPPVTVENCWRNLVAAVLLQAARDLREPGYRRKAATWLCSQDARQYAELLDIEPNAIDRLLQLRGGQ